MTSRILLTVLLAATSSLSAAQAPDVQSSSGEGQKLASPSSAGAVKASTTVFPAAGVKLDRPEGFEDAENFHGFQQTETGSSVMVISFPGPFAEITGGFAPGKLEARGMKLVSKEDVGIGGATGVLVHLTQSAYGIEFAKWILAFGNQDETKVIIATFPASDESGLSERLKAVVLSTTIANSPRSEPGADAGFTIVASDKLKLGRGIGKMLVYTKDGTVSLKSPEDPLFAATQSISTLQIDDPNEFAKQRFFQIAHTKINKLISHEKITIDGLEGYETIADGEIHDVQNRSALGTPLKVYQAMLFDGKSYIVVHGLVGAKLGNQYLPEFKAMAHSLKRTEE